MYDDNGRKVYSLVFETTDEYEEVVAFYRGIMIVALTGEMRGGFFENIHFSFYSTADIKPHRLYGASGVRQNTRGKNGA